MRFVFFLFFSGFARLKEASPERHPAPERCRYANIVTCNAHHASHVKVLCTPLFWGVSIILGGLGVFNQPASLCQPLPPVARRRLWEPTSTRASRCGPTSPLSPSEDRLANILRGIWGGFLERKYWGGFCGKYFDGFFAGFFSLSCGLLATKNLQNPP